jgi:hypothetical protein
MLRSADHRRLGWVCLTDSNGLRTEYMKQRLVLFSAIRIRLE